MAHHRIRYDTIYSTGEILVLAFHSLLITEDVQFSWSKTACSTSAVQLQLFLIPLICSHCPCQSLFTPSLSVSVHTVSVSLCSQCFCRSLFTLFLSVSVHTVSTNLCSNCFCQSLFTLSLSVCSYSLCQSLFTLCQYLFTLSL